MSGAPAQQQPMLAGVQMAQTGQPGKYVTYLRAIEMQGARKANVDAEILPGSPFRYNQVRSSILAQVM